ncbi:MAG TPA: AMP-binding protein, partial [Acidimicrobiia bacterium]|nr:AMP-binding protein [Acidimicrobiia bacterium]
MTAPTWEPRHPSAELARHYRDEGWWTDDTLTDLVTTGLAAAAALPCRVRSRVHPFAGTVDDIADAGRRLAGALLARGVGPGDVVAFQLPNWAEAVASLYGLLELGAVLVPIVHIYGAQEVGHILRQSRARVLITADRFGRQDYLANLEAVRPGLDDLELVIVVPAEETASADLGATVRWWGETLARADALDHPARVDPDSPVVIGYTSGTTSAPKGVIHTHRTFLADVRTWAAFGALDTSPPPAVVPAGSLSTAPIAHITGLTSVLRPLHSRSPLDLLDAWDAGTVLAAMADDRLTAG